MEADELKDGGASRLNFRFDPKLYEHLMNKSEGARTFLEGIVREDRNRSEILAMFPPLKNLYQVFEDACQQMAATSTVHVPTSEEAHFKAIHYFAQFQHARAAVRVFGEWDLALIARCSFETWVKLEWVLLDFKTHYRKLQLQSILYDYETYRLFQGTHQQLSSDEEQEILEEYATIKPEILTKKGASEKELGGTLEEKHYHGSDSILPSFRIMCEALKIPYENYQRLSEWTHGATAGLAVMLRREGKDRITVRLPSPSFCFWCLTLINESLIKTHIAIQKNVRQRKRAAELWARHVAIVNTNPLGEWRP